jgi:hypothetical protein
MKKPFDSVYRFHRYASAHWIATVRNDKLQCKHPPEHTVDHADNPSRYRCLDCSRILVDYGDGLGYR